MENIDVYAKCPYCDIDLDYHDRLSIDCDDAYFFVNWSVFCPQCQRTYVIAEDYKLTDRRFVDESEEN